MHRLPVHFTARLVQHDDHKVRFGGPLGPESLCEDLAVFNGFGVQSKLFSDPVADGHAVLGVEIEGVHVIAFVVGR